MAFDAVSLRATIDQYGGESRVLAIQLNNAFIRAFPEGFDYDLHLDDANNMLVFTEADFLGRQFKIVKPIEYVESVIFAVDDDTNNYPDLRYVRG